jgi:uncharacterized protein YegP (UPF0339 family)
MLRHALIFGLLAFSTGQAAAAEPFQVAQKDKSSGKLAFEIYQDARSEWRWRLLAANGKNIGTSGQGYKQKASLTSTIDRIRKDAGSDKLTFDIYQDKAQEHRWRLKAANGQTIGESGQGYKSKADCQSAVETIKAGAATAEVRDAKKSEK